MVRAAVLVLLVFLGVYLGGRFFVEPTLQSGRENGNEAYTVSETSSSKSRADADKFASYIQVNDSLFELSPLEPCGSLGDSGFGVLAGTTGIDGDFLSNGRQLLVHMGSDYAYAVYYAGEGGTVTSSLCTGGQCSVFDVATRAFVGELEDKVKYKISCAASRETNG